MGKMKWLLLPLAMLCLGATPHPLKMTVCDVKFHADKGQLLFKFFHDDLEALLEKRAGKPLDLTRASAENDQLVAIFIARHFLLNINGVAVKPRLFRSTIQDVVLVAECRGDGFVPAAGYQVSLTNTFFLEEFSDQYNLVRFDFFGNGNLETMRFEKAEMQVAKWIGQ
jgi:hypothetical protein